MKKEISSRKEAVKKPLKKIKSFNLGETIYKDLTKLLEDTGVQVSLSVLVDDFLRKLYVYLIEAEGFIKKRKSALPLSQVIYDCQYFEYFREANKKNLRVLNLIWVHEASQHGMTLTEYLQKYTPEEILEDN